MFAGLRSDIRAVFDRDPAARTLVEVLLCYPGLHALLLHRLAHLFWRAGLKLLARLLSYFSRWLTGIEIHPGAQIGRGFFIDHGMGVVIGETAQIGDNVTVYHGATLGGVSWNPGKRHPTLEDNVIVGAGATVLGPVLLGKGCRIGSNAVVVKNVPPGTTVVGIPGRVVMARSPAPVIPSDSPLFPTYGQLEEMPDPVARAILCLVEHTHHLDRKLKALEARLPTEGSGPVEEEERESCSLD